VTGNSILTSTSNATGGSSPPGIYFDPQADLTVNGATMNADPTVGVIDLQSENGSVTVSNATIGASDVELTSGNTSGSGSITVQNSSIIASNPLTLTSGATSGTVTVDNSAVQGSSVTLFGATGVNTASNSTFMVTGGNLDITTTAGGINLSASTLNAIAGPSIGDFSSGDVNIGSIGGVTNISGTSITAANQLELTSDTGVSVSGASTLTAGGFLDILADETLAAPISVTGNSTLTSGTESNMVFQAGTDLTVNGATLKVDPLYGEAFMTSDSGSITVQNASITAGAVSMHDFGTSGSVTVQNTSITTPNISLTSGSTSGAITVQNSTINAPTVTMTSPSVSASDLITVNQNTSITASTLTLNSGDGILLDGTGGLNGGGSGTAILQGDQTNSINSAITVNNANFTSFASVSMSASTIVLTNVIFPSGGMVHFTTWNYGAQFNNITVTPGYVNFIGANNGNCFSGGTQITPSNWSSLPNFTYSATHG
jgi:hypothetical protein